MLSYLSFIFTPVFPEQCVLVNINLGWYSTMCVISIISTFPFCTSSLSLPILSPRLLELLYNHFSCFLHTKSPNCIRRQRWSKLFQCPKNGGVGMEGGNYTDHSRVKWERVLLAVALHTRAADTPAVVIAIWAQATVTEWCRLPGACSLLPPTGAELCLYGKTSPGGEKRGIISPSSPLLGTGLCLPGSNGWAVPALAKTLGVRGLNWCPKSVPGGTCPTIVTLLCGTALLLNIYCQPDCYSQSTFLLPFSLLLLLLPFHFPLFIPTAWLTYSSSSCALMVGFKVTWIEITMALIPEGQNPGTLMVSGYSHSLEPRTLIYLA